MLKFNGKILQLIIAFIACTCFFGCSREDLEDVPTDDWVIPIEYNQDDVIVDKDDNWVDPKDSNDDWSIFLIQIQSVEATISKSDPVSVSISVDGYIPRSLRDL